MAGRGSVKLSIYSTFKDDGTKKAERALAQFAKKYGEVDKATGKVNLNKISEQLAIQSTKWDLLSQKCYKFAGRLDKAAKKFAPFSAAAAAALGGSVKLASDFEEAMAKVSTITDTTVISMEDMGDQLLDVSNKTGIAVTELAEAAYQAQSAGVESASAVDFVANASKLAKSGFTETATAVDVLTTAINAYGMEASDAQSLADKLVQTQNMGKTTVDELAQSIGQAIPSAAAYGVSIDNLLTGYVTLTKQGINTANATTYLNSMMTELGKEGSTVSQILQRETGKSFTDLMNDGSSLGDVLGVLYDSVDGDSTAFANLWGNVRAGKGALAIMGAGTDEFNAQLAGMADSAGTVDAAMEKLETPALKAKKALNALKNTGIQLGQQILADIAPALDRFVQKAQELYEKFRDMPKGTKQAIAKLLAFTAALAPMLKLAASGVRLFGDFAHGMAKITANLAKFASKGGAAASFAGKFGALLKGPVMLGIMAAVAGIALLVKGIMDWKKKQENLAKATNGLLSATKPLDMESRNAADSFDAMGDAAGKAKVDIDGLIEKQAQLADTIAERNEEAQVEIAMLNRAKDTIDNYANATGLSVQQQGELQAAIALVNEECGTQYEVVDAVNGVIKDEEGNLLDTTEAIDKYIEAKKKQLKFEAIQENLKDLYKQQYEAEQALIEAEQERDELIQKQAEHTNQGTDAVLGYNTAVADAEDKVLKAADALDKCNTAVENTEKQMGDMEKATGNADKKLDKLASTAGDKGAKLSNNFAKGIDKGRPNAIAAAYNLAYASKLQLTVDTYSLGSSFSKGFARGIADFASSAATAAANMAQAAVNAAKAKIKPGSPSKVMRYYGEVFGQGFEAGIIDEYRDVANAAAGMAQTAIDQFGQRPTYQGGYGGGSVTNIYIDGAKINDDPAVRGIVLNLMGELRRLSYA